MPHLPCPLHLPHSLRLPHSLEAALWSHARRDAPRECVGAIGGVRRAGALHAGALHAGALQACALYPLPNVAAWPEREYLAAPEAFVRALKAMRESRLELVGLYHSHPRGPATPSETDRRLAAYAVPYLIADLRGGVLRAYRLPEGEVWPLELAEQPVSAEQTEAALVPRPGA